MAHSNTHFIFMEENISSYKRKISDSVRRASSLFDERKSMMSLGLAGQQSLRNVSSWLRSRTSSLIDSLVGVKEGDLSTKKGKTNTKWYLDEPNDWLEQELVLGQFFPSTVDRIDVEVKKMEDEARYCRDELNIVYLAVSKLNTTVYEDVFDGPISTKDHEHNQEVEIDPVFKLARAATEQDIQHYEEDTIGQVYSVSSIHFRGQSMCDHIRGDLQVSVDEKDLINVDACLDLELDY